MLPLCDENVAFGRLYELIPLLSVALAVYVTVCVWEPVVSETVESLTVKDEILGLVTSLFVTLKLMLSVDVLPAASLTVAVLETEVVPNP